MDSEGLDMLEVVESLSTEKAAQIFKGERVEKYFEACPETGFAGGKFGGVIDDVVGEALDEETGEEYTGLLFHIQ